MVVVVMLLPETETEISEQIGNYWSLGITSAELIAKKVCAYLFSHIHVKSNFIGGHFSHIL